MAVNFRTGWSNMTEDERRAFLVALGQQSSNALQQYQQYQQQMLPPEQQLDFNKLLSAARREPPDEVRVEFTEKPPNEFVLVVSRALTETILEDLGEEFFAKLRRSLGERHAYEVEQRIGSAVEWVVRPYLDVERSIASGIVVLRVTGRGKLIVKEPENGSLDMETAEPQRVKPAVRDLEV